MCGIFGIVLPKLEPLSFKELKKIIQQLYLLSESRGKESAGIHIYFPKSLNAWTLKTAQPASKFINSKEFKELLNKTYLELSLQRGPVAIIAHSRLVTNGKAEDPKNNQPVHYNDVCVVHNGIIVNNNILWNENKHLKQSSDVDTEIIAAILADATEKSMTPTAATCELYQKLKGSASIAWLSKNSDSITLATNTGDLFYYHDSAFQFLCFASERFILIESLKRSLGKKITPSWIESRTGISTNLNNLCTKVFSFGIGIDNENLISNFSKQMINSNSQEKLLIYNAQNLAKLKRCTKCILPETFPYIYFDITGVCNYCRNYIPKYKNVDATTVKNDFINSLSQYQRHEKNPDVIVPFSGGRDSCYGLHLIKKEFNLNPITFTYDWGMITDLARRNISRLCSELGVQNILVSADIKAKRRNIRKNISAWLKKPALGIVPLFMAGDKHFFTVVNQIKKQTGIKLNLWCANPLENTDFKSGFCGVAPDFNKSRLDYLSASRKIKLLSYFSKQFISNPLYLNSSLTDTLTSFISYYLEPRKDFYFIFNHLIWNEDEVNNTIINKYDFELSADSPSSWRIGDGTAPFYNYIYVTAGGFSEFDTFRSNQIREGAISREYAIEAVLKENYPRIESLRWYVETVNLDFDSTIKQINKLDTYRLHS